MGGKEKERVILQRRNWVKILVSTPDRRKPSLPIIRSRERAERDTSALVERKEKGNKRLHSVFEKKKKEH